MVIKKKDLELFLEKFPQMSLRASSIEEYVIEGTLSLDITHNEFGKVSDDFSIRIIIPKTFPEGIPDVFELGDKFPKTLDYHTNPDASLCLGSKISLQKRIKETRTIEGFIQSCVVPYFYAIALYLQGEERFVFGELKHGLVGIIQEYLEIFELKSIDQVIKMLDILSMKKNLGNKMKCPCGCNRIVSKCLFHKKIVDYRNVMSRKEYAEERELISLAYDTWKKDAIEKKKRKGIPLV